MGNRQRSEQQYLQNLGRLLLWFFPFAQVVEILMDYQSFFCSESRMKPLESPRDVLREMLAESPQAKCYFFRHIALWGVLMVLSVYLLFSIGDGFWIFLFVFPLLLFGLIHGWEVWGLERRFPTEKSNGKLSVFTHCLLVVLVLLTEGIVQFLFDKFHTMNNKTLLFLVRSIDWIFLCFQLFAALVFFWMLAKIFSASISYYLGVLHAFGAFEFLMETRNVLHSLDLLAPGAFRRDFWLCLVCYGVELGLAALLALSVRLWISRRKD